MSQVVQASLMRLIRMAALNCPYVTAVALIRMSLLTALDYVNV